MTGQRFLKKCMAIATMFGLMSGIVPAQAISIITAAPPSVTVSQGARTDAAIEFKAALPSGASTTDMPNLLVGIREVVNGQDVLKGDIRVSASDVKHNSGVYAFAVTSTPAPVNSAGYSDFGFAFKNGSKYKFWVAFADTSYVAKSPFRVTSEFTYNLNMTPTANIPHIKNSISNWKVESKNATTARLSFDDIATWPADRYKVSIWGYKTATSGADAARVVNVNALGTDITGLSTTYHKYIFLLSRDGETNPGDPYQSQDYKHTDGSSPQKVTATISSAVDAGKIKLTLNTSQSMPYIGGVRMYLAKLADGSSASNEYLGSLDQRSFSIQDKTITISPDATHTVYFASGPRQGISLVTNATYLFMVDSAAAPNGSYQSPDVRYERSGASSGGSASSATLGALEITDVTKTSALVKWPAVTWSGAQGKMRIIVQQNSVAVAVQELAANSKSYLIDGLKDNTVYGVEVEALTPAGGKITSRSASFQTGVTSSSSSGSGSSGGSFGTTSENPSTPAAKVSQITDVVASGGQLTTPQGEYTHALSLTFASKAEARDYRILKSTGPNASDMAVLIDRTDGKPFALGKHIDAGGGKIKFNILLKGGEKNIYYTLAVVALNSDGAMSDPKWGSYVVEDPFLQRPGVVSNLKADSSSVAQNKLKLTWSDSTCYNFPAYKTFEIRKGEEVIGTTTQLSYDVTGLSADTSFTFGVRVICTGTGTDNLNKALASDVATTTVRTLKAITGSFQIEGRVEAHGVNNAGIQNYRLIIKRSGSVNGIEDKWVGSQHADDAYVSQSRGLSGFYNFVTQQYDGKEKCADKGYCTTAKDKGFAVCATTPGTTQYVGRAPADLLLSNREMIAYHMFAGVSGMYFTVIGLNPGDDPERLCETPELASVKSNELFLNIPVRTDTSDPVLTFDKVASVDKVANNGFVTSRQVTVHFNASDDRGVSKCTLDYGKGEKDLACVEGQNASPHVLPDDLAQGDVTFKLVVTDETGKKTTKQLSYVLDLSAPTFKVATAQNAADFAVACEDGTGSGCLSAQYKLAVAGACANESTGWIDIASDKLANVTIPSIPQTATNICLRGRDAAGNFNEGQKLQISLDRGNPEIMIEPLLGAQTKMSAGTIYTSKDEVSFNFQGVTATSSGITACEVTGDIQNVTGLNTTTCTATGSNFTVKLSANDGIKTITMKVRNAAGKEAVKQFVVRRDTSAPTFENNAQVSVSNMVISGTQGKFSLIPGSAKDDVALDMVEFRLMAGGQPINLSTDMLSAAIEGAAIVDNRIVVLSNAAGAFDSRLWTQGMLVQNLPTSQNGQPISYTVEQKVYDKAGTAAANTLSKTFTLTEQTNTAPITVSGGAVTLPATSETNTIPVTITFSASPVFYTLTENGTESAKVAFNGSIYLANGNHTGVIVKFYDASGARIGNDFGPMNVNVTPKGTDLVFVGTAVEYTKEGNVTLAIASMNSAAEKLSYRVVKDGVQLTTGERTKAQFGTRLDLPNVSLTQNTANIFVVTVTEPSGAVNTFTKTIVHDTLAPEVKNVQGSLVDATKFRYTFKVEDKAGTPVKSIKARVLNLTNGQKSDLMDVPVSATQNKDYIAEFSANVIRPGHEYVLGVVTEDTLGNISEEVRSTTVLSTQKTAKDLIDMYQKIVLVDGSQINTDTVKVILSNGKNIEYTSQLPRGKAIVFDDLLKAGGNAKNNNQKLSKLPVGSYTMTVETVGGATKKTQTINSYMVEPYLIDVTGDLNGDGVLGMVDRELFLAARQAGRYQMSDQTIAGIVSTIDNVLSQVQRQNIVNYLRN